jgi:nitrite reductase/ring-hydroxylating ferredoxin subunit
VFDCENEIGIFRNNGQFYAYSNFCLHQGGPAREGLTIARVEERLMPDKTSRGLYFSEDELHFVCPWHGYEYDIKTGECVSDCRLKLRKYKIVQKGDEVYVVASALSFLVQPSRSSTDRRGISRELLRASFG